VLQIIRAKTAPDEMHYLRLLREHRRLRKALLKLGSSNESVSERPTVGK
jgi:hypothetical protein